MLYIVQAAGYSGKVKIGMDVAASEFLTGDGKYDLNFKNKPNDGSEVKTGCALGRPPVSCNSRVCWCLRSGQSSRPTEIMQQAKLRGSCRQLAFVGTVADEFTGHV